MNDIHQISPDTRQGICPSQSSCPWPWKRTCFSVIYCWTDINTFSSENESLMIQIVKLWGKLEEYSERKQLWEENTQEFGKNTCNLSIKEVGGVRVVQSDDEPVSEKSLLHHSPTNLSFPDQPEERFSYHKVLGWNYWFYYSHWRNKVRTPLVA